MNINTPKEAIERLVQGNKNYVANQHNSSDLSDSRRKDTAHNGQFPYAIIVSCSDSRVPPEHIFSAGIGDLFVVRTAGNVVSEFDLASIEYGAKHLGAKVIVVMGHNLCGAIKAAMANHIEGHITSLMNEIKPCISRASNQEEAEKLNIINSYNKILKSDLIKGMIEQGKLEIIQTKYDLHSGVVEFF